MADREGMEQQLYTVSLSLGFILDHFNHPVYSSFTASIRRTAAKLTADWSSGLDFPLDSFLSIYAPNVEWYDHAYHAVHVGHAGINKLRSSWLNANKDLKVETKAVNMTATGCVIQYIGRGKFAGDVLTIRKATEKNFVYQACLVLDINDKGLVSRVEEYYSFLHDDGVEIEEYRGIKMTEHKL